MDVTQIRKAIAFLSTEIDKIAGEADSGENKIGLRHIDDSGYTMLWVARGSGADVNNCWYILDDNDKAHYQVDNGVTGILTGLSLRISKGGKEDLTKLSFWMQAGEKKYRIESGMETVFSRGILLGLNSIPHEDRGSLLTIAVKPSNETSGTAGNVVYGNVYDAADNPVRCKYDKTIPCKDLLEIVAAHFEMEVFIKDEHSGKQVPAPVAPIAPIAPTKIAETYEVKGVQMTKADALRYYYGQLKIQADRLGLSSPQTTLEINRITKGKVLKELDVPEVAKLVATFQNTPIPQKPVEEPWSEDDIPF
jgi:hypothetical protein